MVKQFYTLNMLINKDQIIMNKLTTIIFLDDKCQLTSIFKNTMIKPLFQEKFEDTKSITKKTKMLIDEQKQQCP